MWFKKVREDMVYKNRLIHDAKIAGAKSLNLVIDKLNNRIKQLSGSTDDMEHQYRENATAREKSLATQKNEALILAKKEYEAQVKALKASHEEALAVNEKKTAKAVAEAEALKTKRSKLLVDAHEYIRSVRNLVYDLSNQSMEVRKRDINLQNLAADIIKVISQKSKQQDKLLDIGTQSELLDDKFFSLGKIEDVLADVDSKLKQSYKKLKK